MLSPYIAPHPNPPTALRRLAHGLLYHNWLTAVLGASTGVYSALLTAFGERWPFFAAHPTLHGSLFTTLAAATAISASISGWYQARRAQRMERGAAASAAFLLQLIQAMAQIVDRKLTRLHKVVPGVNGRRTFQQLMFPADQIDTIMASCAEFLRTALDFDVAREELDITILVHRSDHPDWRWFHGGLQRSWIRCEPNELFGPDKTTMANYCYTSGQVCFLPSKEKGAELGRYTLSGRDHDLGCGSAYGFPVSLTCMGVDFTYIISIVSYRKMLCDEADTQTTENMKTVLREFCRRLEIEVHLRTVKLMLETK